MASGSHDQTIGANDAIILPQKRGSKFSPNANPMNPDKVSEMNMDTEGAPPKVTNELIAARAYEIWQQRGCPEDCDIETWLQAEEELRARNN